MCYEERRWVKSYWPREEQPQRERRFITEPILVTADTAEGLEAAAIAQAAVLTGRPPEVLEILYSYTAYRIPAEDIPARRLTGEAVEARDIARGTGHALWGSLSVVEYKPDPAQILGTIFMHSEQHEPEPAAELEAPGRD